MKRTILLLITILLLSVPACSQSSEKNRNEYNITLGYPPQKTQTLNESYPVIIDNSQDSIDFFITATPDPSTTPIIVLVEHFDRLEAISIINISEDELDIGAYMVFSPLVSERIIVPQNTLLGKGDKYTIYNGDHGSIPEQERWLDEQVVTNVQDEIWLTNMAGRIIYYYVHYPSK